MVITSLFLAAKLDPQLSWLEKYIAASASIANIHLPDFCTIDPPADPGLSGTDLIAILVLGNSNPDPGPMQRLAQLIERGLWNALCQCTSGGPPTVTVPTTPPSGAPDVNPPAVPGVPTIGDCYTNAFVGGAISNGFNPGYYTTGSRSSTPTRQPLPSGATNVKTCGQAYTPGAVPYDTTLGFQFWNAAGTSLGIGVLVDVGPTGNPPGAPTSQCKTQAIPAGAVAFDLYQSDGDGAGKTGNWDAQWSISCGGLSGSASTPCCPPDDIAAGLLTSIYQMVTLIQRQLVPFASIHGASHAGLSGNGSISVFGLQAVKVDISSAPGRVGEVDGEPVTLWDVGWINLGTADGFGPRQFITSDPFLLQPVPGNVTVIGYSIPDDVTVTITEIVREF